MTNRINLLLSIILLSSSVLAGQQIYIVPKPQIVQYQDSLFNPYIDNASIFGPAYEGVYRRISSGI